MQTSKTTELIKNDDDEKVERKLMEELYTIP